MGPSSLILKNFHVDFNPFKDPYNIQKVWVILPRLYLVVWQCSILEGIRIKNGFFSMLKVGTLLDDFVITIRVRDNVCRVWNSVCPHCVNLAD